MAGLYADGVYARKPWIAPPEAAYPPQEYIGPFQSNQERLLSQSLAALTMSGPDTAFSKSTWVYRERTWNRRHH
jgi:hypothetical protein